MMKSTIYEMDYENGKLKPVTEEGKTDLIRGDVIRWGGNMGCPTTDYVVLDKITGFENRTVYKCVSIPNYDNKNPYFHNIEAYHLMPMGVKTSHTQHHYILNKTLPENEVLKLENEAIRIKAEIQMQKDIIKGKKLYDKFIPSDAKALIVAHHNIDDSDSMTDYFGHRTDQMVILGYSMHTRDLFSEMRKYADRMPETKHLSGPIYEIVVKINKDFHVDGSTYWKGNLSMWHREITEDENGHKRIFYNKEDALKYMSENQPGPIVFDGVKVDFSTEIEKIKTEHREKWAMGGGYYLKYGHGDSTGWKIRKECICKNKEKWYISLAKRCVFSENQPKKEKENKPNNGFKIMGVEIKRNHEKNGIEVYFPAKPAQETLNKLKSNGFRWGKYNKCWYKKYNEGVEDQIKKILA